MAKVRSLGLLPTSLATKALAITFQSVTTSARAGETNIAAATMPGSKVAAASFRTHIIGRLPLFLPTRWVVVHPRWAHSHVMPVSYFILCDLWTYVTFGRAVAIRAVNTLPASARKRERRAHHCSISNWQETIAARGAHPSRPKRIRCRNGPCTERAVKVAVPR